MSLSLKQGQSYVRVARRFGVRGFVAGMVPGIHRLLPIWRRTDDQVLFDSVGETLTEVAANLKWAREIDGAEDGHIRAMMAPSVPLVHTPETLGALRGAAE